MRLVHTKQLEGNGIPCKSAQNICYEGNSFVRGIAFSNRLRHLADDIYHAEVESGNSCLIVEDETHFTLWHQESTSESVQATQVEAVSNPKTVQHFVQHFAATKRVQPRPSTPMSETVHQQPPPAGIAPIMTSKRESQGNNSQRSSPTHQTINQIGESLSTSCETIRQQPVVATLKRTAPGLPRRNSIRAVSTDSSTPLDNLYFESLPARTSIHSRSSSNYGVTNEVDSNLIRVWASLSKPS